MLKRLEEMVAQVISIFRGPTMVEVDRAEGEVVKSTLWCGLDLAQPWIEEVGANRALARRRARARGVQVPARHVHLSDRQQARAARRVGLLGAECHALARILPRHHRAVFVALAAESIR